jgi:biopolymer transport protein ExbB
MEILREAFSIILDGGWVMVPLFILGLLIYGLGLKLWLFFRNCRYRFASDEQCWQWIRQPEKAEGPAGEIVRFASADISSLEEIQQRFEEIRLAEVPRINQSIVVLNIMVNAAPLLGLLGTVLGMLTTFQGISMGGAEKTTTLVADGIREALITTQMGLFLAIPGYFLVFNIKQKRNHFTTFLVRLESIMMQHFKGHTAA